MDKINEYFESKKQKLQNLENAMCLIVSKSEIMGDIEEVTVMLKNMKVLQNHCRQLVDHHQQINAPLIKAKMRQGQRQQLMMLNMLEALEERNAKVPVPPVQSVIDETSKENVKILQIPETPRMSVMSYYKSPMAKSMRPVQLQFTDFEASFTESEFLDIPKYMRNRTTYMELLDFLNGVILKCFTSKYLLQCKNKPSMLTPHDQQLWRLYREQASDFMPGQKFVTQGDIGRTLERQMDKKMINKCTMLRHLGILKEERRGSTVYYLWRK